MLFKLLIVLHTLGATVWTGGHLVLAVTVLPEALKTRNPDFLHQFERNFEGFGLASLVLQVVTGLWLTWNLPTGFSVFICVRFGGFLLRLHQTCFTHRHHWSGHSRPILDRSQPDEGVFNCFGLSHCGSDHPGCTIRDRGSGYSLGGIGLTG